MLCLLKSAGKLALTLAEDERGQGTVEAAVVIPVLFLLLLMLIQPGFILYDRLVMNSAAAEACRLLATCDISSEEGMQSCTDFVKHRLAAIPQHDFFHVHNGGCTWDIRLEGGESSGSALVSIKTEVRPLPLFDASLSLLGITNGRGNLEIEVERSSAEQPAWVMSSAEGSPAEWVGAWCS